VLITILATVALLFILITVHELGHFFAAKAVNIQVPRFSLGFGKALWGFRIGETEFVVGPIPLGGYVKMAGMEDDEASSALEGAGPAPEEVDPERTFDRKPLLARVLVISAGVIMNLLFAWLVYGVIIFAYGIPRVTETRVSVAGSVVEPAAPGLAGIREGARVVAVNGRPVREWNDLVAVLGDSAQRSAALRFADAPPVTLALPAGDAARSAALAGLEPWITPVIEKVERGKPARRAGLRAGDRVVAAEGAPVRSWQELVRAIQSHPEKPLRLSVARGARVVAVTVTPDRANGQTASGKPVAIGRAGAGAQQPLNVRDRVGAGRAVVMGARATWGMAAEITGYLVKLVKGELSARNMGGLLSIGEASGQTARMGLEVFLGFLAAFSVNLAVLNLLPIPILDGGHLMFLAFEAVRGRPLSVEARIRLSHVGLVILFALMIWANGNDVLRLVFGR
jgi:regulator of sigma E protease